MVYTHKAMLIMIKLLSSKKFIIILIFSLVIVPQLVVAFTIINTSTIRISAQVGTGTPSNGGGGGGGGGGSSSTSTVPISMPTTVNFSGMAYPSSKVTILRNGSVVITTVADQQARFSTSINNLDTGTYNFSVYGEDSNGVKSLSFSFPVYVTAGTTVNIGGIFLSPTINIDKSEVKQGDDLIVYGQTIPNTNLNIVFHSDQEILKNTKTDITGLYKYTMDTTPLEYGDHIVKSKTIVNEEVGAVSPELPFIVGLVSKKKDNAVTGCGTLRGDLNCDKKVNLVDFSIMAYWYKRVSPPEKIDLNGDGKISLVDFSIMAFNWTG